MANEPDSKAAIEETEPDLPPVAIRPPRPLPEPSVAAEGGEGAESESAGKGGSATDLPAEDLGARPGAETPGAAPSRNAEASVPRRTGLKIAVAVVGILLGIGVALVLIAPSYLRGRVVEEARARGYVLALQDVDVGFSTVTIDGAKIGLVGVADVEVTAARLEIDVEDWQPRAVRANGLTMALYGTDVLDRLSVWRSAYPGALAAPLQAEGASVRFHLAKATEAALSLERAKVAVTEKNGTIAAGESLFLGRPAGAVDLGWTAEEGSFVVDVRPTTAPLSALRAEVRSTAEGRAAKERPRLVIFLAKTALGPLQKALGIPKGSEGLSAEGKVEMPLPSLEKPAPVSGSLRMSIHGFVPPHPKELDGILFGETTRVSADFELAADFGRAKLSHVDVEAGALSLRGLGDVEREGFDAAVSLTLKGSIPCAALATSAAMAHLGVDLGRFAGGLAAGALKGNVSVVIHVEAQASDIQGAKIDKSARLACKVSVPGLPQIVLK